MERKKTTSKIRVGESHMSQLLFSILFITFFLLCTYIYSIFNIRPHSKVLYDKDSMHCTLDMENDDGAYFLADEWIFVPNMGTADISINLNAKAYTSSRPYADGVSITSHGWEDLGKHAVWHNTPDNTIPDFSSFMNNGMRMESGAYIMDLELPSDIHTLSLDLGKMNGHAFVYSNGYFAGNIGDTNHFMVLPNFTGGYQSVTLQNTSDTLQIIIVVYSNSQMIDSGLITIPALYGELESIAISSVPTMLLAVMTTFTLIAIAGGFLLSRTFSDPRTYYFFSFTVTTFILFYLVNCNFLSFTAPYRVLLEFLFLSLTLIFSYGFITFLFTGYHKNRKTLLWQKTDYLVATCIGFLFMALGLLDSRLLRTTFHTNFLLTFVITLSALNVIKVLFRHIDSKNATIGICASISFLFIFLSMIRQDNSIVNIPLYAIFYLIALFSLLIYFVYRYIYQYTELVNTSNHMKRLVEEKTEHISMINRDLYRTNKKLLENEEARKNVMSNVSHDLRTPITAIRGYSELLLQNGSALSDEQKNLYLQNIVKRSTQMERIVSDIVEITKMESSGFEFEFMDVSLNELLDELYMLYASDMRGGDKKLILDMPDDDLLIVKADPKRISRVFENLISNAINYSKEKAEIKIKAWRTGTDLSFNEQRIHITIEDNGIGIPAEEIPRIFDRFYRAKNSGQNIKGTGLGLSIVKMIIDKHNAEISVESVLGEGTTFHIIMKPTY